MTRIFSSRKGQALEALENALERCEREGIKVLRNSVVDVVDDDTDDYEAVTITIPNAYWDKNSILLYGEEFPKG